jgi:threonine dehydratase
VPAGAHSGRPVGGGGLVAGVAVAVKDLDPVISVVGVQAGYTLAFS